jgi:hypothetical protein
MSASTTNGAPGKSDRYTPYGTMTLALRYGAILAVAMLIVGGGIGFLVSGMPGLAGALIGTGLTAVLMGLSAASVLLAVRVTKGDPLNPLFYAVVLGASALKIVAFFVIILALRDAPFIDPRVMYVSVIVAVAGSLVVDALAFARARVPYVDVELPGGQ